MLLIRNQQSVNRSLSGKPLYRSLPLSDAEGVLRRCTTLLFLTSASRFICFFRYRSRPKWTMEMAKGREHKKGGAGGKGVEQLGAGAQWRRAILDGEPSLIGNHFTERNPRKSKWENRVVTTWKESRGFSLYERVIDRRTRSIGIPMAGCAGHYATGYIHVRTYGSSLPERGFVYVSEFARLYKFREQVIDT